jgi:hypothetical protein
MTTAREQTNELASMLQRERGGLVDFLLHPASAPRPSDFLRVKLRPGWTVVRPALNFTG